MTSHHHHPSIKYRTPQRRRKDRKSGQGGAEQEREKREERGGGLERSRAEKGGRERPSRQNRRPRKIKEENEDIHAKGRRVCVRSRMEVAAVAMAVGGRRRGSGSVSSHACEMRVGRAWDMRASGRTPPLPPSLPLFLRTCSNTRTESSMPRKIRRRNECVKRREDALRARDKHMQAGRKHHTHTQRE